MDGPFQPRLESLALTLPQRVGSPGGPSRGAARGPTWRRTGAGLYVPAGIAHSPEQRIAEVALPSPDGAAITGWAALRLEGAAYFDGRGQPVSIVVGSQSHPRPRTGVRWIRREHEVESSLVHGLPAVPAAEALLDHVLDRLRAGQPRLAVVAVDMALAARVCSKRAVTSALAARSRVRGRTRVAGVLELAEEGSASPPESHVRLLWRLDTDIPGPMLNPRLLDPAGRLIGVPDLLEPTSGLVVEYDGSPHATSRRRARDAEKDDLYREYGLECVRITGPDMTTPLRVLDRLNRAYARAIRSERPRGWTLGDPFTGAYGT